MIGEADRLISATEKQQAFTGWYTILWGFEMILPRAISPNKPVFSSANYLSHIAGDSHRSDFTTQWAYGVMANFFNAFSFLGTFIGTTVFFAVFYYYLRLCFDNPRWHHTPFGKTIWLFFIIALFHHSLVESDVGGLIAVLPVPLLIAALRRVAVYISPVFGTLSTNAMKKAGENQLQVPVLLRFRRVRCI